MKLLTQTWQSKELCTYIHINKYVVSTVEVNLNGRWPKTLEKVLVQRQRHYTMFNDNIFCCSHLGLYFVDVCRTIKMIVE